MGTLSSLSWWQLTLLILLGVIVGVAIISLVVMAMVPVGRGIGGVLSRVFTFVKREILDALRAVACLIVAPIFGLLALLSLFFIQMDAAAKFGKALREEVVRFFVCVYRVFVGNPARAIGLEAALEGVETRLPGVLSGTWGDVLSPRESMFPGYEVVGTLPGGGSGAKLYIAKPDKKKLEELLRDVANNALATQAGTIFREGDRLVIKSFTTFEDTALPQLVRESRGLEAGKRLGLILDHGFGADRFYYVMRYVPGEHLRNVTTRLHQQSEQAAEKAEAAKAGLGEPQMRAALSYTADLLGTLALYHEQGLWHKDVKPDNIIIEPDVNPATMLAANGATQTQTPGAGRARLVDIGLVSSLRSAMTLTTHGTEYYRDPEMVRQALKGVKVSEVDGTKFDLYAAGAVLYSMIEDSFPAQGVLSPIEKKCPPAVAWIIRRAMADYRQRYASARDMLHDVQTAMASQSLFTMRLVELPSMKGQLLEGEAGDGGVAESVVDKTLPTVGMSGVSASERPPAHVPPTTRSVVGAEFDASAINVHDGHRPLKAAVDGTGTGEIQREATSDSARAAFPIIRDPAEVARSIALSRLHSEHAKARASDSGEYAKARLQRVPIREPGLWQRITLPAMNSIGLPTRVKIVDWWTGRIEVEE